MGRTGVVIDERCLAHDTGRGHPERPERVGVLLDLVESRRDELTVVPARLASADELALVHDGRHVEHVAATEGLSHYAFDPDTPACAESYAAARLAAGGLLALIDEVAGGTLENGFALVRPPGHHAERMRAMGFCLFNNVAVGAEYLRRKHGYERVLIVDWDLHHGNGTQHLFEGDPGVMYVSTHQFPYYPGTGDLDEQGHSDGEGYTVNLPFPAGFGDGEYGEAFRRIIEPIAHRYEPDFVLISAGFDCHGRDPLGGMRVSEDGFRAMTRSLLEVAKATSGSRCVAVLEGGYDLQAIRNSTAAVLDELQGRRPELPAHAVSSRALPHLERIAAAQRRIWPV